ncbi:MAG TPA: amidase [Myxococcota bacterium]|nr:amidase [Myxococcota bacterium]
MSNPVALTLTELAAQLQAKKLSPVELMNAVLGRIDATNPTLNAVVAMHPREKLLEQARAAEARIARGEGRALEGIPLGVKDLEDTAGLVTSHGSVPYKDNLAERDSVQVERLRGAGAIPVGKTNAPEFGYTAITKNLVFGTTHSPWNPEVTPGGSSGGSAAALAGLVLPLVTASDGGGSTRIPASFVGAFGLKPSYGRIPHDPSRLWYFGDTAVHGPLTKTVADNALYLDLTCGYDRRDPKSLPHPGFSYRAKLAEGVPKKLRIAYSPDLGYAVVQSDVAQAVYDAVRVFEKLGHEVVEIPGGPPKLGEAWGVWGSFEMAAAHLHLLPEHESEFVRANAAAMKGAWDMKPEWFSQAAQARLALSRWAGSVFSEFDLLVTPTVPYDPPPAKGPFPRETEGRKQLAWGVASFTIPFNLSLHPACSLRVGISRAGLPIGLQIVAERHRDELVLQAAQALERERPAHPHWPAV